MSTLKKEFAVFRDTTPKGQKLAGLTKNGVIIMSRTEAGAFEPLHYVSAYLVDNKISREQVINADQIENQYPFFWPTYDQLKKLVSPEGQALGKMFNQGLKGGAK